jgi:acyl transferase domain-containing protein
MAAKKALFPSEKPVFEPIAIVGMGCLFPGGATDPTTYWANCFGGIDCIREVPAESHWSPDDYYNSDPSAPDRTYGRQGGFLDPIVFDCLAYGISPANLEATDTTQLLAMVVARQALKDAGFATGMAGDAGKDFPRERTSVIMGVTSALELLVNLGARLGHPHWRRALEDSGLDDATTAEVIERIGAAYVPWQENSFPGLLGNVAAGRIASRFDLGGSNTVTDAACASSLASVHTAIMELQSACCDVAISGGCDTFNDIFMYMCFSKTPALSPTGSSRPFAADGDGTILGEGLGAVVLKRLRDAEADGDQIRGVITGLGGSSDGSGKSIYAPNARGQARAIRRAWSQAGVSSRDIELIEAHGTGTKVGDAEELQGLLTVFEEQAANSNPAADATGPWCAVGSVKSQIGHTKSAAGIAGLMKATLALEHHVLPPSIKVEQPLAQLDQADGPLYFSDYARPWVRLDQQPRHAGVSAFGFGGSNYHAVLQESPQDRRHIAWDPDVLAFAWSAGSQHNLLETIQQAPDEDADRDALLKAAAASRATFQADAEHRLTAVCRRQDWPTYRAAAIQATSGDRVNLSGLSQGTGPANGSVALLFSGQGSQKIGMWSDLICRFPIAQDAFSAGASTFGIDTSTGRNLAQLIYPPKRGEKDAQAADLQALTNTAVTQPALAAVESAGIALWHYFAAPMHAVAGHSFGELSALYAAGAIDATSLHTLAKTRGAAMATCAAAGGGSMTAVLDSAENILQILGDLPPDLVLANHNSPKQTVISGADTAVAAAQAKLEAAKVRCKRLPVSAAFHSPLVAEAQQPLHDVLSGTPWQQPNVPVIANATAQAYPANATGAKALLTSQVAAPVRFVECIEKLYAEGARTFVEIGPGRVLSGLTSRILGKQAHTVHDLGDGTLMNLAHTLFALAAAGQTWDMAHWQPYHANDEPKPKVPVILTGANAKPQTPVPPTKPRGSVRPVDQHPAPAAAPVAAPITAPSKHEAPMPPAPTTPAATGAPANQQLVQTLIDLQQQTTALHQQFLANQEAMQNTLATLLSGQPVSAPSTTALSTPVPAFSSAPPVAPAAPPVAAPQTAAPTPTPPVPAAPPTPIPASSTPAADFSADLLTVVAEKTGYPEDALEASMGLDADLGIDSIKRVEILSAFQERRSDAPTVDAEHLGGLRTLGDILEYLNERAGASSASSMPNNNSTATVNTIDFSADLLAVVAEKTGYPEDALEASMDLDADLGIDSIKRVEILSAFQERRSDAPTVDAEHLGGLRTLGDILDYLDERAGNATGASAHGQATNVAAAFDADLLAVVAEKTGYPEDALEPSMDLDADLGIDSIKRVEILSAFQERRSDAPTVDAEHLGSLRTLGDILGYLNERANTNSSADAAAAAPAPATTDDFSADLLAVVAEKTGYPEDALEPGMDLDADLGIDSIKRVEILSAFQERRNDAPTVDAEHLGGLRTLGDILAYLNERAAPEPAPASASSAAAITDAAAQDAPGAVTLTRHIPQWVACDPAPGCPMNGAAPIVIVHNDNDLAAPLAEHWGPQRCQLTGFGQAVPVDECAALVFLVDSGPEDGAELAPYLRLLQHYAPALQATPDSHLIIVTEQDGQHGFSGHSNNDWQQAAVVGMAKTAAHEWPAVTVSAIDLQARPAGKDLTDLAAELKLSAKQVASWATATTPAEATTREFGWNGQENGAVLLSPAALPDAAPAKLTANDTLLVTGGGRGVTAAVTHAVAAASGCRVVLLGRSPEPAVEPAELASCPDEASLKKHLISTATGKPNLAAIGKEVAQILAGRELRQNIERIAAVACEVLYRQCDVTDADGIAAALETLPITAVIHGAGVLRDKHLADLSADDLKIVYDTKVGGWNAVFNALDPARLKAVVFFASSTGRFGRTGQAAYAAANAALAGAAHSLAAEAPATRVVAVDWGPWDGGMVDASLANVFRSEGIELIPLQGGADYLVNEIATNGPAETVLLAQAAGGDVLRAAAATPQGQLQANSPEPVNSPEATPATEAALTTSAGQVHVTLGALPALEDHRLHGDAVVPLALMAEWLLQSGCHSVPDLSPIALNNVHVRQRLALLAASSELAIDLRHGPARMDGARDIVETSLRLQGDHVVGTVVLGQPADLPTTPLPSDGPGAEAKPSCYSDGRLFHGPSWQKITRIGRNDATAIKVDLAASQTPTAMFAPARRDRWLLGPAAVDGALQAAILWCQQNHQAPALPIGWERFDFQAGALAAATTCAVIATGGTIAKGSVGSTGIARFDCVWHSTDGRTIATMSGLQMIVDPSLAAAFARPA